MHEAEQYLRNHRIGHLYVRYRGEKRRLSVSSRGDICMVRKGHENWGNIFSDREGISKIYCPDKEFDLQRKPVEQFRQNQDNS
jgi:hypothetical protein